MARGRFWAVLTLNGNRTVGLTLSPLKPFLCAECYGIQHIKTGFSGERVKPATFRSVDEDTETISDQYVLAHLWLIFYSIFLIGRQPVLLEGLPWCRH